MLETMMWGGLRVAAALLLMMGVAVLLRSASAATRHAVWRAGFGVALLLPVVALALPWKLEVLPEVAGLRASGTIAEAPPAWDGGSVEATRMTAPTAPEGAADEPVTGSTAGDWSVVTPEVAPPADGTVEAAPEAGFDWSFFLVLVWLTGAALLAARLVVGHVAVSRIVRGGRRLTSADWTSPLYEAADIVDVAVDVDLVSSERVTMPFTAGVRRPVIVLPETADSWSIERRRAVLMHELAHVRRRDLVPHHVARWVCALHWFNPLAWAGARRMRAESERAADDLVLNAGTRASDYADHLLQIVSSAGRSLMPAPALPLAQRREFEGRMLAILEPGIRRRGPGRFQSLAVTALVLLMTLPLAALDREGAALEAERHDALAARADELAAANDALSRKHDRLAREHDARAADVDASYDFDTDSDTDVGSVGPLIADIQPNAPVQPKAGTLRAIIGDALAVGSSTVTQGEQNESQTVPALVRTLSDPNVEVRRAVVAALGEMADPRAVQALIRILREDPVDEVRAAAAWALGEIEDAAAVPALAEALRSDVCEEVRQNAAWALGQIEDARAVDALGAALRDSNEEVRRNAMWALGEIESPAAVPSLVSALQSDDAEVRQTAAWALGQIEDPRAVDGLSQALRSGDAELRETAAWALGEIESPAAVQALMPLVADEVPAVREAAVHALAQIEDPAAAPALVRALSDGNPDVRSMAAHAISDMGLQTAPPALIGALRDGNADVRMAAAHALGDIGDPAAVDGLTAALQDANTDVRLAALHALLEMDEQIGENVLLELLQHEDANVRKHAAEALGDH